MSNDQHAFLFTNAKRPLFSTKSDKLISKPPWTAAKCHRTLRPLISQINALRRVSSLSDTVPPRKHEVEACAQVTYDPFDDLRPRKALKRTYGSSANSSNSRPKKTVDLQPLSDRQGQISIPTPVIRRTNDQYENQAGKPSDSPSDPSQSCSLDSERHGQSVPCPEQQQRMLCQFRRFMISMAEDSPGGSFNNPKSKSRSLLSTCLRSVPTYITELDWQNRQDDPDDEGNAIFEIYSFLESFEVRNGLGWRGLRELTLANGVSLTADAIKEGHLSHGHVDHLVGTCISHGQHDAAHTLLDAFSRSKFYLSSRTTIKTLGDFRIEEQYFPLHYERIWRHFSIFGPKAFGGKFDPESMSFTSYHLRVSIKCLCNAVSDGWSDACAMPAMSLLMRMLEGLCRLHCLDGFTQPDTSKSLDTPPLLAERQEKQHVRLSQNNVSHACAVLLAFAYMEPSKPTMRARVKYILRTTSLAIIGALQDVSSIEHIQDQVVPMSSALILMADTLILLLDPEKEKRNHNGAIYRRLEYITRLCQATSPVKTSTSIDVEPISDMIQAASDVCSKISTSELETGHRVAFYFFHKWMSQLRALEPPKKSVKWCLSRLITRSCLTFAESTRQGSHRSFAEQMDVATLEHVDTYTTADWETPARPSGELRTWQWDHGISEWVVASPLNAERRALPQAKQAVTKSREAVMKDRMQRNALLEINANPRVKSPPPKPVRKEESSGARSKDEGPRTKRLEPHHSIVERASTTIQPHRAHMDQTSSYGNSIKLDNDKRKRFQMRCDESSDEDELSMNLPAFVIGKRKPAR